MEKFKLNLKYRIGDNQFKTSSLKNKDLEITYKASKKRIYVKIKTKTPIEIDHFSISLPYKFERNDRVFVNGYQSWTDCREMFIDEIPQHTFGPATLVLKNTLLGASGAYNFTENTKNRGEFIGFSYMYVRDYKEYDLFASLTERTGYTIFKTDCSNGWIHVIKDLEGVVYDGEYEILDIVNLTGESDEVFDEWFNLMNIDKPAAKVKNGYTTWYNYYSKINQNIVTNDLEALSKINADVDIFQVDDGYQTATGDWLVVDENKFPNGMKYVADKIHEKNMLAGIWIAPFGAEFNSKVLRDHPEWFIRCPNGRLVTCGPNWGGFCALDIEVPEAREYIKNFFDYILNEWGFDLVKLDFLYAAAQIPNHNKTRGQLMCEAMDFLRECVGDKEILGCGVPLMPAFGKVDYCRIGADVGLSWNKSIFSHREIVSTINTLGNTIFRRQLNGRAFLNDPDVFHLRDNNIRCNFEQKKIISTINKLFGSVLFTSDDVSKYNQTQMDQLIKVFTKDDIKILKAEFLECNKRIITIDYLINGEFQNFKFNLEKGTLV